jgi:glutamine amidotransferase
MSSSSVTLIDYGMCNMLNVQRALMHAGGDVTVTADYEKILQSDRLVLPGVGAFADCMKALNELLIGAALKDFLTTGKPVLAICVGMQVLFETSDEFGSHQGLGLLPGHVRALPERSVDGHPLRRPHINWSPLSCPPHRTDWTNTLLEVHDGACPDVYFVHSYAAQPSDPQSVLAQCQFGGHAICAAVQKDNLTAFQFHPERSGPAGLALLQAFLHT